MADKGRDLDILVIDDNADRAAVLEQGLVEAGYARVMTIRSMTNLVQRVQALAPDVVIIGLANPDRDTLESMFQVSREVRRPIAMFVDQSDGASITAAIEAGVSAYVVDGLRKDRVRPIVEMAVSRFAAFDRLRRERDDAVSQLAERKVIEKAKGLMMEKRSMTENEAYTALRQAAMRQNRRMVDIAVSVITAFEMEL
ncbi:MAG: ANTAR domain-containing protein [Alphaproteobacteria bacterium]|nr:ANTAR domain-containing protein [Alphaproteobacteria bacterium]MBF0129736.1 ANTAR domain-containing protein [Alphaproteobacteria bacterium]